MLKVFSSKRYTVLLYIYKYITFTIDDFKSVKCSRDEVALNLAVVSEEIEQGQEEYSEEGTVWLFFL